MILNHIRNPFKKRDIETGKGIKIDKKDFFVILGEQTAQMNSDGLP